MAQATTLRPAELRKSKILVRVPNWVGDAVMTLPALRALRNALPQASITLLARPWVRDVYPLDELRFEVIDYDSQSTHRGVRGRLAIARALQKEKFNAALLFQNAFDAALVSSLAGIPIRAGYARDARRLLLTHPVKTPLRGETPAHESHYYLELLKRLTLISDYQPVREIELRPKSFRETAGAHLRSRLPELGLKGHPSTIVGISPGASFGTAKRWPADRFSTLITQLETELGAICILFGSAQEAPLADEIADTSGGMAISLAGKTRLSEFMELVAGCDAYITNDTGTMHVAAALGVPTIAIFGSTNELETAPLGRRVDMVIGEAECRPCKLRHCPYDHHKCMTSISPAIVFDRVRLMLQGNP